MDCNSQLSQTTSRKTMDRTLMVSQITCISLVKITESQTLNLMSQEKD
jgi:hypothetical protein